MSCRVCREFFAIVCPFLCCLSVISGIVSLILTAPLPLSLLISAICIIPNPFTVLPCPALPWSALPCTVLYCTVFPVLYCSLLVGHYVKDLSLLNRDLSQTIIVDNSPMSYIFHPENAIDCGSFIDDLADIELWQVRSEVLCCAVLCCAVLCCAVLCCAVLCCAVLCCAVLCCAVLCCAVLCCAVLCCAVHFSILLWCVLLIVWYKCRVLSSNILWYWALSWCESCRLNQLFRSVQQKQNIIVFVIFSVVCNVMYIIFLGVREPL